MNPQVNPELSLKKLVDRYLTFLFCLLEAFAKRRLHQP